MVHWAGLLAPRATLGGLATVAAATAGGAVLLRAGRIASRRTRNLVLGGTVLALLLTAIVAVRAFRRRQLEDHVMRVHSAVDAILHLPSAQWREHRKLQDINS